MNCGTCGQPVPDETPDVGTCAVCSNIAKGKQGAGYDETFQTCPDCYLHFMERLDTCPRCGWRPERGVDQS